MGARGGTRSSARARGTVVAACLVVAALSTGGVAAGGPSDFTPGADGIGDPYFPKDGNGGYDVSDYDLAVRYDHRDGKLSGVATITATATQDLSRFNLDLVGLKVRSIEVDGADATWRRGGGELVISPGSGLAAGSGFVTAVRYDGVPAGNGGLSGFARTGDGAVVMGEPDVAASWFPVNDHPLDAATYSIDLTVRKGRAAISNGILTERRAEGAWTTWSWRTEEEIAPYLATAAIGKYETSRYTRDGLPYFDAIERVLLERLAPRTGRSFAVTGAGGGTFQRLTRTISVPRKGGRLSFAVARATESGRDFAFVEARPAGGSDWTTLPDRNGHTTGSVGVSCAGLLDAHPFLTHYQTVRDGECTPRGSTGRWHASSGASGGYERWSVDLSRYAGTDVQVAISYASDPFNSLPGVGVDDIKTPGGEGVTSFEADGDRRDGWRSAAVGGGKKAPTWVVGGAGAAQPSDGKRIQRSLDRQPEIIAFLAGIFGEYPYSAAGGVVHGGPQGFALETATRPLYSYLFFSNQLSGDSVVVHELAHQWFGDSVALAGWQHIWLNEGFASYAEWLWSEGEDLQSADEIFAEVWEQIPADEEFWKLRVGDPGPSNIFQGPIYTRGAMTLHQLRQVVGDETFFRTLRAWATERAGDNVTTDEFIAVAERESGKDLGGLFDAWLFTDSRPELPGPGGPAPE